MSGLLALTGVIFLPSLIWSIFIPGGIVWLCWLLIAVGVKRINNNWFWTSSVLWNVGWLAFFLPAFLDHPPGPVLVVVHCSLAVAFSLIAITLNVVKG